MPRITQGAFSFLPDLSDDQISAQIQYALDQGWAVSLEHTDDPHPRNTYWDMWGTPMFDLKDAAGVMGELKACRTANPESYIRLSAFDSTRGWETVRLAFMVHRPEQEAKFRLERTEGPGRVQHYSVVRA
ncbi:MAG: ribulose bisphosphate carboxylase small subunit [Rhodoplanes sp.]|uniref:ribulose bisphosphate carboxylase small subunit n=1 Tax=Rhodoplanes sp. TaxID=1968906 RepID=UPI0017FFF69C|nr:ribulose bisphosphate carboxylase small subunit [Rhodoplanes sp.]NVO16381.1 ribulose bisphosphate carboxylase small subunit [Rhodoplanes sp.]